MSNVNSVTISGNLTRDPEYKAFDNGGGVVSCGIAVNRRYKNENAEDGYTEVVSFIDFKAFGPFASLVGRKMKKGDSATVQGRLEQESWENAEGEKRSKVLIVANEIDSEAFFRSKDEDNALDGSPSPAPAPAADPTPAEAQVAAAAAADDDIPF